MTNLLILTSIFTEEASILIDEGLCIIQSSPHTHRSLRAAVEKLDAAALCMSTAEMIALGGIRSMALQNSIVRDVRAHESAYSAQLHIYPNEHLFLSTAEQNQAVGRRKSRPLGAASGERREGVARLEFPACGVGYFREGFSLPFGRGFGRDGSFRRSSRGC